MKILFAAVFTPTSTNVSQANALRRQGHEVVEFPYRDMPMDDAHRDLHMVVTSGREKCDMALLSKCNGVGIEAINALNDNGSKTVLWFMDAMHNFDAELRQKVEACSASFFALMEPYRAAREMVGDRAHFLQEGFDPDVDKPMTVPVEHDVVFIGNLHSHPGDHRTKYHQAVNFRCVTDRYGEEHAKMVCGSRINLNFTHGGTSDRAYKIMAAGGFLLTEPWPGMDDDFTPGEDFDTFTTPEELRSKISHWLVCPSERIAVAKKGLESVQKFSRDEWARKILEE
jgi:hypothetical protein